MFEGPVTQDVTTLPLANEGDISTGQGQQKQNTHIETHTHGRNAAAVTKVLAVTKGLKYILFFLCVCVCVCCGSKGHGGVESLEGPMMLW